MIRQSSDNVYNQSQDFWEQYIKGRPAIPQTFFDFIFKYHSDHNGRFDAAHEVGAGVGVHSPRLAKQFKHVLVSDVIDGNVQIAKTRLQGSYSFKTSSLEDCIDLPAESVDLVFASTMMHFTRVDDAVKAVHHQLKPGGTFAAGLYGTYALHDVELQKIWCQIVLWICDKIVQKYGLGDRCKMILQNEASGLDSVGLPAELFSPAMRYEYNFPTRDTQREMILPAQYGLEPISRIGPDDKVVRGWDRGWFSRQDIDGLKGIASTWPHDETNPEIVALWGDLHRLLGDGEVEGAWMVSLLLATKKLYAA
jgi:SAM-dependent methyltransferase